MGEHRVPATTNSHSYRGSTGERIVAAVARLTGGRIGGEVSDHEALQRRHSPAAEHDGVSSNDPWEKSNSVQKPPCESSALCSRALRHRLTRHRPLALAQAVPPLVDLKHRQTVKTQIKCGWSPVTGDGVEPSPLCGCLLVSEVAPCPANRLAARQSSPALET